MLAPKWLNTWFLWDNPETLHVVTFSPTVVLSRPAGQVYACAYTVVDLAAVGICTRGVVQVEFNLESHTLRGWRLISAGVLLVMLIRFRTLAYLSQYFRYV